ncbi:DUF3105 domain-containing protein [Streptomyces sp. NPDC088729]|uniref:DUF3105 domain-containing protein n=1 Tax=Streptomyces sp. NPDC088729 TaxID=3365876 RepID=UPI0037F70A18
MSFDSPYGTPAPQPDDRARGTRNRALAIGLSAAVVAGLVAFGSYVLLERSEANEKGPEGVAAQDAKGPGEHQHAEKGGADIAIKGLKSWDAAKLGRDHTSGPVDYPMRPPVGGDHNPTWMNCDGDVYERAVPDVNAVHSLEHGSVWVTYSGRAADADVRKLAARVGSTPFSMMSPYADQKGAIVLTAWGKQLTVDDAEDARVDRFFTQYVQGAQTPEPGAPCTGGLARAPR